MARTRDNRRWLATGALALFLIGTNFCVVTGAPMLSASPGTAALQPSAALAHPCCAAAAARARRDHAARESTAPCCVAMAPVLTPATVSLHAAPAATAILPIFVSPTAEVADFARVASAAAVPPRTRAATPDAGRAPPRL